MTFIFGLALVSFGACLGMFLMALFIAGANYEETIERARATEVKKNDH